MYELAKAIITYIMSRADFMTGGIYNGNCIFRDPMDTIYDDGELQIYACRYYGYFEVFGLSDEDFEKLKEVYESLRNEMPTEEE